MHYLCCLTLCRVSVSIRSIQTMQSNQTMIETFTADQVQKQAGRVYRSADKNGKVIINNSRYPDKIFELTARERRVNLKDGVDEN